MLRWQTGPAYRESDGIEPGNEIVLADTALACFDCRSVMMYGFRNCIGSWRKWSHAQ